MPIPQRNFISHLLILSLIVLCSASGFGMSSQQSKAARAVQKAIPLIQLAGQKWLDRSTCTSCHHQSVGFLALQVAKDNGFKINSVALQSQYAESSKRRYQYTQKMYELTGAINPVSGHGYQLLGMSALRAPANDFTDAAGFYLTAKQSSIGHWPSGSHRPPIEDSAFTLAATSVRALQVYPFGKEGAEAIEEAKQWLMRTPARSAEDRAMKLLGLCWTKAPADEIQKARNNILNMQLPNGGWAQVNGRTSDSYATGQALVALKVSGNFPSKSTSFQRAAKFLISTQKPDGSWRVPTRRVVEGLPYFETGFPHKLDQFISMSGTCWATTALAIFSKDGNIDALTYLKPKSRPTRAANFTKSPLDEALFQATLHGTVNDMNVALDAGADPNCRSTFGTTPLIIAVRSPEKVKLLLEKGANPNLASTLGTTPLTVASATHNAMASMRLLLGVNADPNAGRVKELEIPILSAAASFNLDRVKLLVDRGSKIHDDSLAFAYAYEDLKLVNFFLDQKVDLNLPNKEYGGNSVNDAVVNRNVDLVALLLKRGGNPNEIDKEGFSALQVAASGDPEDSKIVELLLAAGADVNYKTKGKPKAFLMAKRQGNIASAELIRKKMAEDSSRPK